MIKAILLFFYLMFSQFANAQNSEQITNMIVGYDFETQSHCGETYATLSGMALKAAITSLKQGAYLCDTTKYPLITSLKMGAYLTDTTKFKLAADSIAPGGWASNYDVSLKQNLLSFVPPNMMNMTGILVHKNIAANQNTFKPVMNGAFLVYCSFGGGCDIRYGDFGSGLNQCTIFNRVTIVQTDEMINCVVSDDKDIHQVAPHHDSQFIVGISDFSATLDMNDPGIYDPVSFQLTIPANYIYVGIITLTNGGGRTIQFINGLSSVLLQVQFRSSDFDSFSFSTTNRGAPPTSNSIVMNGYLVGGGGININGWDGFTPSDNITITNHFSSTINTIIGYPNIY